MEGQNRSDNPLAFVHEEMARLREKKSTISLRTLQGGQRAFAEIDGRRVINLASHNYLGLATHPKLKERAIQAIGSCGLGIASVRSLIGNTKMHQELEARIAGFLRAEAAVLFPSGLSACAWTVASVLGKGDLVISDEFNHGATTDGCRLSRADIRVYPHGDMARLAEILEDTAAWQGRKLLVTDGVFGMEGDIAPLQEIVALGERHGCIVMVNEAHSLGVLGRSGSGAVDYFRVHGRVPIQVGSLAKAIGVIGGFACGSAVFVEYLQNRARPLLLSSSMPPAMAAAGAAAFEVLEEEPELVDTLWDRTRFFAEELRKLGFNTGNSETPIIPAFFARAEVAVRFSHELFQNGVFAPAVVYPVVPLDTPRVRAVVTAHHSREDLTLALAVFESVGRDMKLI